MSTSPKKVGFAEAFMRERARYQVSRSEIGRHVGVAEDVVKRWERGEAIPNPRQFKRLITRLHRMLPHVPEWGTYAGAAVTGQVDEYRDDAQGTVDKWVDKIDAAEKPPIEPFGLGLKRVREENDVTQDELGELLGLTGPAVGAWETEVNTPVIPNLAKLFEVLPELRAGIETGAIKRPPSQSIAVPTGGRGFPRASTIDQALDMALAQSDEEAKRPRAEKFGWASAWDGREHEHRFDREVCDTDPAHDPTRSMARVVCSICGAPRPESPRRTEVRLVKAEHEHKVRRCPCGGETAWQPNPDRPGDPLAGAYVCLRCQRALLFSQTVEGGDTAALAINYARARVALARAKASELAASEALTNAATDRRNAEQECDDALALLDIAVQEEAK